MVRMRKYATVLGGSLAAIGIIGFASAEGSMTQERAEQLNREKW
jgi:hypothetical protein